MDALEGQLLAIVQDRVPLVSRPFEDIAKTLGVSSGAIRDRLSAMKAPGGVIREIVGIFDARMLGYRQVLTAFAVRPVEVDRAGQIVAGHPGVSHCYGRSGRYNLWFTLSLSPTSSLGLEGTVQRLAQMCGAARNLVLPAKRRYKLHVRARQWERQAGQDLRSAELPEPPKTSPGPDKSRRGAIRALQTDLPLVDEPFEHLARNANMTGGELLSHAAEFVRCGWMRRCAALIRHRAAGAGANVMVAWQVRSDLADDAGAACSRDPAVSHCYLRPARADWPYQLYTMVHGPSAQHCRQTISRLAASTGLDRREELWTEREYKKKAVRLFDSSQQEWEEQTAKSPGAWDA